MSVILSKASRLAKDLFGLELPLTEDILKTAFRRAAKKCHSDTGGKDEDFIQLKNAYDFLTSDKAIAAGVFSNGFAAKVTETTEGIPLSELGLGLGPTTNGRDCEKCDHKGYVQRFGFAWQICKHCDDSGTVPQQEWCMACESSGKFKQRSGRIVDCYKCKGTGIFTHPYRRMFCPRCRGTKKVQETDKQKTYYERCSKCNGTGEIEIFNPVIPKGRLAGLSH